MPALPADGHVHSEFSWDARTGGVGDMEGTCARAVELGLPAVAFTEHVDHTTWATTPGSAFSVAYAPLIAADGMMTPPPLDVDGYLAAVERCRHLYPGLRILTGIEAGEPHWFADDVARLLAGGRFERVLGSLHSLQLDGEYLEPPELFGRRPVDEVMRAYLAELHALVVGSDAFAVLAHIDYAARYWPEQSAPYDPGPFEDELRHVLRALAATDRALEVNTRLPLHPDVVSWWRDEGGRAVTFGSDAHEPIALALGFREAADMVESFGFRPGSDPWQAWLR
jgi:histidinol-phosphatase (PHP family)